MNFLQTTLCIANITGRDIDKISVTVANDSDWMGEDRPSINFQKVQILNNGFHCEREDIFKNARSACYKMVLIFSDGRDLIFENDQRDSETKYTRCIDVSGSAADNLSIYQISGGYTNTMYIRPNQKPVNASWMGELLDRKPGVKLNEITMPGSHDAGMYTTSRKWGFPPKTWVLTQSNDIGDQLKFGARYFDLNFNMGEEKYG